MSSHGVDVDTLVVGSLRIKGITLTLTLTGLIAQRHSSKSSSDNLQIGPNIRWESRSGHRIGDSADVYCGN